MGQTEPPLVKRQALEAVRQKMRDHYAPLRPAFVAWLRELLDKGPPAAATWLHCINSGMDGKVVWLFNWQLNAAPEIVGDCFPASPVDEPALTEDDRCALGLRAESMMIVQDVGQSDFAAEAWEEAGGYQFSCPVGIGGTMLQSPADREIWTERMYSIINEDAANPPWAPPEPPPQREHFPAETPAATSLDHLDPQRAAARLAAEQVVRIAEFARYGSRAGLQNPSVKIEVADLPVPAREAFRFYHEDQGNDSNVTTAYRLSTEAGLAYLIEYDDEGGVGAVEVYSETGELWGSGPYQAGVVVWQDQATVRQQVMNCSVPADLFFKTPLLEWIPLPEGCQSLGGRFMIYPDRSSEEPSWILAYEEADPEDQSGKETTFSSIASAQARAAEIHALG